MLNEIIAFTNLQIVRDKIHYSLEEIKEKNAHRTDLIDSMQKSKDMLIESIAIFDNVREQKSMYKNNSAYLFLECQKKDLEIEKLKQKISELMDLL
jgi:hypothetical protein